MSHNVVLIHGDGIGPEVTDAARRVLDATGVEIFWEIEKAGEAAISSAGTPLPGSVIDHIRDVGTALKGPVTTPVGTGFRSVNVALRHELDLYACLRPCKYYAGVPSHYKNVDVVIVRENSEDLYAGIEFERGTGETAQLIEFIAKTAGRRILSDSGISLKPISETASRRIVRFAFEYARTNHRYKVTAIHKANIMKFTDGLFLSTARAVSKEYPYIEFEDLMVDNMAMQLVRDPAHFDVIVTTNLYGDILSDLCAGMIGGLGLAPGANIGDRVAVFEATHGSAPKHAGLNRTNPMALILSGVLMLRHLGESQAADLLESAVGAVIREGKSVTYDIKGDDPETAVGTMQVANAIIAKLKTI
ncbi:isocitrate/isopropylmalate dehydrogenase family protein [Chloroflexota bacterium]